MKINRNQIILLFGIFLLSLFVPMKANAYFHTETVMKTNVTVTPMSIDTVYHINLSGHGENNNIQDTVWYSFSPQETGYYAVSSYESVNASMSLYELSSDGKSYSYVDGESSTCMTHDFCMPLRFETGKTYFFAFTMIDAWENCDYDVWVHKRKSVTEVKNVTVTPLYSENVRLSSHEYCQIVADVKYEDGTEAKIVRNEDGLAGFLDIYGNVFRFWYLDESRSDIVDRIPGDYIVDLEQLSWSNNDVRAIGNEIHKNVAIKIVDMEPVMTQPNVLNIGDEITVTTSPQMYCLNPEWKAVQNTLMKLDKSTLAENDAVVCSTYYHYSSRYSFSEQAALNQTNSKRNIYYQDGTYVILRTLTGTAKVQFGIAGAVIPVLNVALPETKTIAVDDSLSLGDELVITPVYYTGSKPVWESSNPSVAQISKTGMVIGKNAGESVITVSVEGKSAQCKIVVTPKKIDEIPGSGFDSKGQKEQTIKNVTAKKTIRYSKLKKKAQTFKLSATAESGKVTYKKKSGAKQIKITSAGKVTVAKKLKKGTYNVKVVVTAAETEAYRKASTTKTVKIIVK